MFSKTVTHEIVKAWAKGATAEETVKYLHDELNITISLHTIYKKRQSIDAQQMIDELLRQQLRDILQAEDKELQLKYRNELLKIFVPIRQEILTKNLTINRMELKVDVPDLLKQYEDLFEEATLLENVAPEPLHPPPPNRETGPVSPT